MLKTKPTLEVTKLLKKACCSGPNQVVVKGLCVETISFYVKVWVVRVQQPWGDLLVVRARVFLSLLCSGTSHLEASAPAYSIRFRGCAHVLMHWWGREAVNALLVSFVLLLWPLPLLFDNGSKPLVL